MACLFAQYVYLILNNFFLVVICCDSMYVFQLFFMKFAAVCLLLPISAAMSKQDAVFKQLNYLIFNIFVIKIIL
jgi:hypothetical protein